MTRPLFYVLTWAAIASSLALFGAGHVAGAAARLAFRAARAVASVAGAWATYVTRGHS